MRWTDSGAGGPRSESTDTDPRAARPSPQRPLEGLSTALHARYCETQARLFTFAPNSDAAFWSRSHGNARLLLHSMAEHFLVGANAEGPRQPATLDDLARISGLSRAWVQRVVDEAVARGEMRLGADRARTRRRRLVPTAKALRSFRRFVAGERFAWRQVARFQPGFMIELADIFGTARGNELFGRYALFTLRRSFASSSCALMFWAQSGESWRTLHRIMAAHYRANDDPHAALSFGALLADTPLTPVTMRALLRDAEARGHIVFQTHSGDQRQRRMRASAALETAFARWLDLGRCLPSGCEKSTACAAGPTIDTARRGEAP